MFFCERCESSAYSTKMLSIWRKIQANQIGIISSLKLWWLHRGVPHFHRGRHLSRFHEKFREMWPAQHVKYDAENSSGVPHRHSRHWHEKIQGNMAGSTCQKRCRNFFRFSPSSQFWHDFTKKFRKMWPAQRAKYDADVTVDIWHDFTEKNQGILAGSTCQLSRSAYGSTYFQTSGGM